MATPARLTSRRDITAAFRHGARSAQPVAALRCVDRGDLGPARLAVTASRTVGNAVARNRAKRRLRAALALTALPDGRDLVVLARPAALTVPFGDLQRQVQTVVTRCGEARTVPGGDA